MNREGNEVEQAVARTVRDSLEKLQRTTEELNQAVNDLVAACASARPTNALPPMLRAQTSAAALSASLEVLSRFVAGSLQIAARPAFEAVSFAPSDPRPIAEARPPVPAYPVTPPPPPPVHVAPTVAAIPASDRVEAELPAVEEPAPAIASVPAFEPMPEPEPVAEELAPPAPVFDVLSLPVEEQELHRRANRVAKVSMQDIKLLRPNDVKLGREHKDLCIRLRDDIEKAHKEYDRRFQAILGHPVDYFYDWMVEILGDGNPEALGAYPYPSPAVRPH